MIIIGADPGKTGALAMIDGDKLIDAIRIPYAAPIERAWVVGGKHSEVKFTASPIRGIDLFIDSNCANSPLFAYNGALIPIYLEEPSMGGVNIRTEDKNEAGEPEKRGTSKGVDASINRAFQGLAQALYNSSRGTLHTVSPLHWQSQLFRVVPRALETESLKVLGIRGGNTRLTTKERARLACLFQWGISVCRELLRDTPKCKVLDSGRCDAACLALFGLLHQKHTPRLLSQPIASHLRDLGVK